MEKIVYITISLVSQVVVYIPKLYTHHIKDILANFETEFF